MLNEEKKAIKTAKCIRAGVPVQTCEDDYIVLLNLIERQQKEIMVGAEKVKQLEKEIKDLNEIKQQICNEELITQEYVRKNCIKKDKIREKIKKYDKWIEEGGEYTESLEAQRYALNELLEEK